MRKTLLPLAIAPLLIGAAPATAPFTVNGQGFDLIQDAVKAIGGGTGTILIAPGVYRQCAVQEAGVVTYKAIRPGTAVFERDACEDKAGLVLRGRASTVDGLVFRNYSVNDGNGEGIRTEQGDLTVVNAMFLDSQQGLGGGTPDQVRRITVDHSTFAGLGQCRTDNCSHSLYLITPGPVTITNSRFERGTGGHYAKIRSRQVRIEGNSFDDSAGHMTSYLLDLPNGGVGDVRGNTFVQGAHKDNPITVVAVAAEVRQYPTGGLAFDNNTASLAPGAAKAAFITDWGTGALAIGNNRLTGLTPYARR